MVRRANLTVIFRSRIFGVIGIFRFCVALLVLLLLLPCHRLAAGQTQTDPGALRAIDSALRARNFEQALELIRGQLQEAPGDARLWTLEGIAFAGSGKDKEALVAYSKALKISPDFLAALEGAAELEFKAQSERAIPLLNRILKLRPSEPTSHAMLGVMAYKKHDCATAVEHFRQARQILPSQPISLEAFGACLMEQQRAEEALPVFEQLLAMRPADEHTRYNLAIVQFTAKRNSEALATLQPLLEQNPRDADVLDLASAACEETGETPKAVALLRQAIVASPRTAKYYVDFAALSYKHESYQVGVDMVNAGLRLIPQSAPLYVARGILLIQMGNFESGQADFESANRLDPREASVAVAEGLAQLQQSNLDQALTTVEQQLKTHQQDSFLQYLKAEILTQKGADVDSAEFRAAVAAAKEAVRLKPDFVLARDVLGNLYLKSGQNELGIEQSRLALRDNPSDQVATYHLLQGLRKTKDSRNEIPGLVKKLATLREESQKPDGVGVRYRLYEPGSRPPDQPR
jgi:tetratricopeptide (TPR) repeat protein